MDRRLSAEGLEVARIQGLARYNRDAEGLQHVPVEIARDRAANAPNMIEYHPEKKSQPKIIWGLPRVIF
ncbi:hypothetical protein BDV26DRAFT_255134 [Aspergillus bertholletiae]|uniref:Uncharacterized protein n=1 Tax=Aspergillus bertholletiae TaxID=1226010 RepID=A0A5N7BJA3_9EURO|nr:hypothetical protein BDV26DRAFT_255134 [Aspergillus bertholletiae]